MRRTALCTRRRTASGGPSCSERRSTRARAAATPTSVCFAARLREAMDCAEAPLARVGRACASGSNVSTRTPGLHVCDLADPTVQYCVAIMCCCLPVLHGPVIGAEAPWLTSLYGLLHRQCARTPTRLHIPPAWNQATASARSGSRCVVGFGVSCLTIAKFNFCTPLSVRRDRVGIRASWKPRVGTTQCCGV